MKRKTISKQDNCVQISLFGLDFKTIPKVQHIKTKAPEINNHVEPKIVLPNVLDKILPISVKYLQKAATTDESLDYSIYSPQLIVENSMSHPTKLSESLAMNSVTLPVTNYSPLISPSVISSGSISEAQIEDIILAGNAHSQKLHNGNTRGFFLGAGTGYGKGRTIAAIIMDNFNQNRKKAIWVSKNDKAHMDSPEYWEAIGGKTSQLINHAKIKPSHPILSKEGILMTTYGTIRAGFIPTAREQEVNTSPRFDQIYKWLGADFDGVIVFDESHKMANALDSKTERGVKKSTLTAQVGLELQHTFPHAKILYASATGATEVHNLIYADRLGLWGEGTPFSDGRNFVNQIDKSGVAAMELVAKDLKSLGLYTAKSLSYNDVEYATLTHNITPPQQALYDKLARAWQIILQKVDEAIELNETNGQARGAALSSFWSTHQRFFNQIILTIQLPSVIEDMHSQIEQGNAIIIQLTNTNEAQTKRALSQAKGDAIDKNATINYDQLDLSPKSTIIEMIKNTFPTVLFETFTDEDGNEKSRPVTNSEGEFVHNIQSVRMRDKLVDDINKYLHIPESPLDTIINTFGTETVAEVTGRSIRIVKKYDQEGTFISKEEKRSNSKIKSEIAEFKDDKRNILIFSDAGGTGASFHTDKTIKNQRRRVHYVFQAGWRADSAVQGFGRSHRSNQVNAPLFKLVTTDIKAQKRFLSSIARRLEQLGALTKGQRTTGGQGILDNSHNLEGEYAKQALYLTYLDIDKNSEPISPTQLNDMMGLQLHKDVDGTKELKMDLMFDTKRFLNRLLSLEIDIMNIVFEHFSNKIELLVEQAKASGNYDEGIEHVKANSTNLIKHELIHTDHLTKAETFLTSLELTLPNNKTTWDTISLKMEIQSEFIGFYTSISTGKIFACVKRGINIDASGKQTTDIRIMGILGNSYINEEQLSKNYQKVTDTASYIWDNQYNETPIERKTTHTIVTGLMFPIWDKLPEDILIRRYIANDGNTYLGRFIIPTQVDQLRDKFNLNPTEYSSSEILQALNSNGVVMLSNKFTFKKSTAQGQPVIKLTGTLPHHIQNLEKHGAVVRIANALMESKDIFIPLNKAEEIIEKIMTSYDASVIKLINQAA